MEKATGALEITFGATQAVKSNSRLRRMRPVLVTGFFLYMCNGSLGLGLVV
jgi:hypothetical protein